MKLLHTSFIIIVLAATIGSINTHAADSGPAAAVSNPSVQQKNHSKNHKTNIDVSILSGVHSMPEVGIFGFLPLPAFAAVSVDINRLRIRTDAGYHLTNFYLWTAGGGILLTPVGKHAAHNGGFQLKIPIMLDLGYITGTVEATDGHRDLPKWLVAGPNIGADFIWWKADRLGFCISAKAGYLFRADVGSDFYSGYSLMEDRIGVTDLSVLLGISI